MRIPKTNNSQGGRLPVRIQTIELPVYKSDMYCSNVTLFLLPSPHLFVRMLVAI